MRGRKRKRKGIKGGQEREGEWGDGKRRGAMKEKVRAQRKGEITRATRGEKRTEQKMWKGEGKEVEEEEEGRRGERRRCE